MLKRGPAIFGSGYYKLKVPPPFLRSLFQIPKESWHTSTANLTTFKLKVKVKTPCLLHSGTKSHSQVIHVNMSHDHHFIPFYFWPSSIICSEIGLVNFSEIIPLSFNCAILPVTQTRQSMQKIQ